jgi:orotidine-5'-phosphate decarboxylase
VSERELDPGNRLIAALDVEDRGAALRLADRLGGAASFLKLGLELFAAEGPGLVGELADRGERIMLDLKLHDIPATVGRTVTRLAGLGIELLTVHACGGRAMIAAAAEAARGGGRDRPRILAVTVLTSLDRGDLADVGVDAEVEAQVLRLATLAAAAGADGVVASPHEAAALRRALPAGFLIVTPGVRAGGEAVADQKRVLPAGEARAAGADLVVVGRPLRDAADPAAVARALVAELDAASSR